MLPAENTGNKDRVLPFFSAIDNLNCGIKNAVVTWNFTSNEFVARYLYCKRELIWEREEVLKKVKARTGSFKANERKLFLQYQASATGTTKWHALDHFPDTLKKLGYLRCDRTGFCEREQKNFKQNFLKRFGQEQSKVGRVIRPKKDLAHHQPWMVKYVFQTSKESATLFKRAMVDRL